MTATDLARPGRRFAGAFAFGAFVLLTAALLFAHAMSADLDHDEHQFVASGALLARRGLLPYRDYPYFHTPNLAFAYAAVSRGTRHLLLGARMVSVACGVGTVAITFAVIAGAFGSGAPRFRWLFALAGALVLVINPLFLMADGLAWNHDAAELLLAAAAWVMIREMNRGCRKVPLLLAAALLGLAVGTRMTVAPATAAFAASFSPTTANPPARAALAWRRLPPACSWR